MKKNIPTIMARLREMHGEPRCELRYANAMELTIATVLSAQCTDERVNKVTKDLFKKYRNWQDYLTVSQVELEEDIRPTGFFRNKAKSIKNVAKDVLERFNGEIPDDIDIFATVKGVGRKSASLIVGIAYGKPAVIVDTHVIRVSGRIGFTENENPEKIEVDLKKVVHYSMWTDFTMLLTLHGRYTCKAKKPECEKCLLQEFCDYYPGGRKNV